MQTNAELKTIKLTH